MKDLRNLIEVNLLERSDDDSYILSEEIKHIIRKGGYLVVENYNEAEKYLWTKYSDEHEIKEEVYQSFDITDQDVMYNIQINKFHTEKHPEHFVLSVLVTEL